MPMPRKPRKNCLFCQTECATPSQIYCSNKCQLAYQRQQKVQDGVASHFCVKNFLLETRGVKCEICSITKWCGQSVPLVMDHIDGNSDNGDLSNLRLVCGNCDMQLPTYKSKNIGKGRHSRRARYANGQSF